MPQSLPLVSFIAVNYIHIKDTVEFLESALQITYSNVEIIVVDNGSPTGRPTEEIKQRFPTVTFIQSEINLGFAGGNNLGIVKAKGDYIFLLNNDTLLFPDFLEPIITFMESHPNVGMASPKVLFADGKTIQYAGAIRINTLGRGKRLGLMEMDHGQYDVNYQTDLGHGAALIIPRRVIDQVGMMPEIYFLYYEEHDWCEQVKRNGYAMYYLGTSKIIHKESVSTGGDESYTKVYYLNRNRILYMRRNFNGVSAFLGILFYLCIPLPLKLAKYLVKGKTKLAGAMLSGVLWNLKNASN